MVMSVPTISEVVPVKLTLSAPGMHGEPPFIAPVMAYSFTVCAPPTLYAIRACVPTIAAAVGLIPHPTHPFAFGADPAIDQLQSDQPLAVTLKLIDTLKKPISATKVYNMPFEVSIDFLQLLD